MVGGWVSGDEERKEGERVGEVASEGEGVGEKGEMEGGGGERDGTGEGPMEE